MPRTVDHEERRAAIAEALLRIAAGRGLHAVSFREVAAEAGVSVALVQHYFGSRRDLLTWSIAHNTRRLGAAIAARAATLGPARQPRRRLTVVLTGFLPLDDDTRQAMLAYHAFAAAAAADHQLMTPEVAEGGRRWVDAIATLLDGAALTAGTSAETEARGLAAMVLGLSLGVLLGQFSGPQAQAVIAHHAERLFPDPEPDPDRGGGPRP